jgi:hypothetical protein
MKKFGKGIGVFRSGQSAWGAIPGFRLLNKRLAGGPDVRAWCNFLRGFGIVRPRISFSQIKEAWRCCGWPTPGWIELDRNESWQREKRGGGERGKEKSGRALPEKA